MIDLREDIDHDFENGRDDMLDNHDFENGRDNVLDNHDFEDGEKNILYSHMKLAGIGAVRPGQPQLRGWREERIVRPYEVGWYWRCAPYRAPTTFARSESFCKA